MIRRVVKIQLGLFAAIGLGALSYAGASVVFPTTFKSTYRITVQLPDSGGIFTNGEVTYRGVNVGRIGALHLRPEGVDVTLTMLSTFKIPDDLNVLIADKSPVGEQYVDLQPHRSGPPYLHNGSVISADHTKIPVSVNSLLVDLDTLSNSVNPVELRIVINELGTALVNTGTPLHRLLDNGQALTASLQNSLPQTIKLINSGRTVLTTARDTGSQFKEFAQGLAALSQQLVTSDPDLRRLIDNGVAASQQLDTLLQQIQPSLYPLLGNLVTLNSIGAVRLPGLKQTLIVAPSALAGLSRGFLGHQVVTPLTLGEDQTPKCTYAAARRLPSDLSVRPTDINQYCPVGPIDPRGARNAPRPPGDTTAGPGNDNGGPTVGAPTDAAAAPPLTGYDPTTGLAITPGGQLFVYAGHPGPDPTLPDQSWAVYLLGLIGH